MPRTTHVFALLCLFLGSVSDLWAFSRKAPCTVRFHLEVDASASDPFSRPVKLAHPPRQIFVEGSAALSEGQIEAVYVFPASDGSWGALFRLDAPGRKILSQLSSSNRGRCFVVFVGNHKLARQLAEDLFIDEVVQDGMLPIPKGLTYAEALLLKKSFKALTPGTTPFPQSR